MKNQTLLCNGHSHNFGVEFSDKKYSVNAFRWQDKILVLAKKECTKDEEKLLKNNSASEILMSVLMLIGYCKVQSLLIKLGIQLELYVILNVLLTIVFPIYLTVHASNSTKAYHAAEHMVFNAHMKSNKIPTIAEAKENSRYSKYCGSMAMANFILLCNLGLVLIYFTKLAIPYVIFYDLASIWLITTPYTVLLQKIILTSKTTDEALEVALVSLSTLYNLTNNIEMQIPEITEEELLLEYNDGKYTVVEPDNYLKIKLPNIRNNKPNVC